MGRLIGRGLPSGGGMVTPASPATLGGGIGSSSSSSLWLTVLMSCEAAACWPLASMGVAVC